MRVKPFIDTDVAPGMKILPIVFAFERFSVLSRCIAALSSQWNRSDLINIIDDSKWGGARHYLRGKFPQHCQELSFWEKGGNKGFSDSARSAFNLADHWQPYYLYLIEGDYIMAPDGLDRIADCFENTPHGQNCLGIVGYDHPNFYRPDFINHVFPDCMKAQLGEDNCNRAVMHRPFRVQGKRHLLTLERVSNTCFSCYLNWKKLQEIAVEFPELNDLLDQVCEPRDNPNYPTSGEYRKKRVPDDGMLSHAINLIWNRWAIKHGVDRNEYSAWLNIKPSVATHVSGGGMHAGNCPEMSSDAMSPSWGMKEFVI